MSNVDEITPEELIEWFRKDPNEVGWEKIDKAYRRYKAVQNKSNFLEPIKDFVREEAESEDERADDIRRWGTVALGSTKGIEAVEKKATKFLLELLTDKNAEEGARRFLWTRFYALRSLFSLAKNPEERYSKASQLAEALVELSPPDIAETEIPKKRNRLQWVWVGMGLVILIIVIGVIAFFLNASDKLII